MDLSQILQVGLAIAVAIGGYFFKRMQTTLDENGRRLMKVEIEVARQNQVATDDRERLNRIEEKIDRLLERGKK
jgi:uncharacterized membrane protein YciS (DUF1049 family)